MVVTTQVVKHSHWVSLVNSCVQSVSVVFMSILFFSLCIVLRPSLFDCLRGNTHERRWFGRTDIIPWPCLFGLYSTRMSNKQGYCRQLQKYVWIQDLFRNKVKKRPCSGTPDAETISSWSYDMEGHAKKCGERYCELANKTTQQLYKVATPRRRRKGICWRIVRNHFSWKRFSQQVSL